MEGGKMTLFFSKRTGDITEYVTTVADMGFYGEDEEDYSLIRDYIVVDRDDYVLDNIHLFKVEDGELKVKDEVLSMMKKYS